MNSKAVMTTTACAVIASIGLGACTGSSSSGPSERPSPQRSSMSTSSSTAPSSSPVTSTPAPSSTAPLSAFEHDPAVQAMRAWAAEAARTVNSGHYDSAALDHLMTPVLQRDIKSALGEDVGLHYPGPVPLQPLGVTVVSSTERNVRVCYLREGYAVRPSTGKPARTRVVSPATAYLRKRSGAWLMNGLLPNKNFSCNGVTVKEPAF